MLSRVYAVWLYRPRMHIVVCMCVQLYGPVTRIAREHRRASEVCILNDVYRKVWPCCIGAGAGRPHRADGPGDVGPGQGGGRQGARPDARPGAGGARPRGAAGAGLYASALKPYSTGVCAGSPLEHG